jgi:hypothetical protein
MASLPFINTFPITASNYFFAAASWISLMVMATSGHMVQHRAQKMQSSGRA